MSEKPTMSKTEQEYLNICEDFKTQIERKNEELKNYKKLYMNTKKISARNYGLICELQDYLENLSDIGGDPVYEHLSNSIRTNVSNILFTNEEVKLGLVEEEETTFITAPILIDLNL